MTPKRARWVAAIVATWLVACHGSSEPGPRPQQPTPEPSAIPAAPPPPAPTPTQSLAPPPPASATPKQGPTASAKPKRDLHPLSPDAPRCLEMYSACRPDGMCTSAPFELDCGQVGTIPGGDTVRCVCP